MSAELAHFFADFGRAPALLCLLDPRMGSTTAQVRGLRWAGMFRERGWTARFLDVRQATGDEVVAAATRSDVVYLLKVPFLTLVQRLKRETRAKVIFDLGDPLWRPMHRGFGWWDIEKILVGVDAVFTENRYMVARARRYNDHVFDIPVSAQVERFDELRATVPARDDDTVVIGWVGSPGTVHALRAVSPALEAVSARHPDVAMRVVGCAPAGLPRWRRVRVSAVAEYDDDAMAREILGMDVGLYPPPFDLDDYRLRGSQKALLYMGGGVPPLCQNAGDCARVVTDGVTGMLARDMDEWTAKLEQLVTSQERRRAMGRRARDAVRAGHSMESVFRALEEALLTVMRAGPSGAPGPTRRARAVWAGLVGRRRVALGNLAARVRRRLRAAVRRSR